MIFRNMFERIFNKSPSYVDNKDYSGFVSLNNSVNLLTAAEANNYQSLFVRLCVDSIAENASKLKPKVIRRKGTAIIEVNSKLQKLIELAPNEYMNTSDFIYKVVTNLLNDNNSFIYIKRNEITGEVEGLYPLNYSDCEFVEYKNILFVRFSFMTGYQMTVPYTELVHLRKFFGPSDLFGESNDITLTKQVGLLNTVNKGLAAAVNSSNVLRGILKFNMNLKEDDLVAKTKKFAERFLNIDNNNGVASIDSNCDYQELKSQIVTADNEQMKTIRNDVMQYFHLNENIIMSKFDENGWEAFYESVLEPLALKLSLELTRKIFTAKELALGNEIIFEANRLQYASMQSKTSMLKELMPMGLMSINEGREIFNLGPVEGGEKRILSLNYIDADMATEYQLAKNKIQKSGKEGAADE